MCESSGRQGINMNFFTEDGELEVLIIFHLR